MAKVSFTKTSTLKSRLIIMGLVLTVALGLSAALILKRTADQVHHEKVAGYETLVSNISLAVGAQFFERYGDVQAFSVSPAIKDSKKDVIVEMLNTWAAMYGIYDLIMIVDIKGRLIAVNSKDPTGKEIKSNQLYVQNFAETPWFKSVVQNQTTDDKNKAFAGTYVEDIQIDPHTSLVFSENRLGNGFSTAIKDANGKIMGVISNRAAARWFEVAFKEAYYGLRDLNHQYVNMKLVDKNGLLAFDYGTEKKVESGAPDVVYDWKNLAKTNLVANGHEAAKRLTVEKAPGHLLSDGKIISFGPVTGPKFVDAMGWGILLEVSEADALSVMQQATRLFSMTMLIVMVIAALYSWLIAHGLSTQLRKISEKIGKAASTVFSASQDIAGQSTRLSEASIEQAAAIQETAASIDEVSAMVKKSADNANQSHKAAEDSRQSAERGKKAVEEMLTAIGEISNSNHSIMNQVTDSNKQLGDIVKLISEIGSKTKVINDIVFQTKLLSFNASVEAARAGEHGKGFAVVAEEVGNLAQMSGNAAKEISSLLDGSISKVESIVSETKSRVERLISDGKMKVDSGIQVAHRCNDSLNEILKTATDVSQMVSEISLASNEQAQGVAEINKAMNQLDQVTQQNTATATTSATASKGLNKEAKQLQEFVDALNAIVLGGIIAVEEEAAPMATVTPIKQQLKSEAHTKSEEVAPAADGTVPHKDDARFEDI